MKIALAQIDTTIGDFAGNVSKIVQTAEQARDRGADLVLFPELAIPGYPAHDLLERRRFIDQNLDALYTVADKVKGIAVVVGFAERSEREWGKKLYNSAALIDNGKIISIHRKCLLPTYDVFDESRYFDPADGPTVAVYKGIKIGITICEDIWNDPDFWPQRKYPLDPTSELVAQGAEIIVNIAASPFTIEKRLLRREMLKATAIRHGKPLLFVNSVGGNDELIFDGASVAFGPDGAIWADAREFADDLILVDIETGIGDVRRNSGDGDEAALAALVLGTKDYAAKIGFCSAILGLSGGIDSALVATIGAMALGRENVTGVLMPSQYSSRGSIEDALQLAENLGIKTMTIPIESLFNSFLSELSPHFEGRPSDVTEENLQARIRGNIIMGLSNKFGHLVLTTGNKSEMATGYCTLYGDMAGGLAVLADVPKTLVYRLCNTINRLEQIIPKAILTKAPSAELKPDQFDQQSLPPYELLDALIDRHIVDGLDAPELIEAGFDPVVVEKVLRLIRTSEYKRRQAAPGLKLTSKAFGYGRRVPLAHRWRP